MFKILSFFGFWLMVFSLDLQGVEQSFRIQDAADKQAWKEFMHSSPQWKQSFYNSYELKGLSFADWHWTWRLAWVKACHDPKQKVWCQKIITEGLFDKALMVRSKSAQAVADMYAGSQDKVIISLLVKAFKNPSNMRHSKPLFVQQHLLYALKKIDGEYAQTQGEKLAKSHPSTQEYWQKLRNFSKK